VRDYVDAGAAVAALELEVTGGPATAQQFSVHEDFRIGSGESGPGTLGGDRWLSASHALFHRGPDGWAIEDLRSVEGTQLNGQALRGAATLKPGDVIELGSSRIVVLPDAGTSAAVMHAESPVGMAETRRAEKRRDLDGKRVIASLLDMLLSIPLAAFVVYTIGAGRPVFWIAYLALMLTYFFLCETLAGRTLGKRVTGLRVVRVDGRPLNPRAVAGRTVLRLIDQQGANLVGLITMIVTGERRQRLGDLAARTCVTRASAPYPRHERRGWERLAVWGYPAVWLAPAVLLFVLVPDGDEGSCLVHGRGGSGIFTVVNTGHTLHMPGYDAKLVRTATHRQLVGFKLSVTNTGDRPLRFDRDSRHVILSGPRLDGTGVESARELRRRAPLRPIGPGRTRGVWITYAVASVALPQLREPPAALIFMPGAGGPVGGLEHLGQLRLWRVSTAAGVKALAGMRD
jgi:uncharacterized RDD family membrane protein YckC